MLQDKYEALENQYRTAQNDLSNAAQSQYILNALGRFVALQNQGEIVKGKDVQDEINQAVDLLNEHLQKQDEKINKIMEALHIENN